MKCDKFGWELEYKPGSFREQIEEIIGNKVKRGYLRCPNCNFKISSKILQDRQKTKMYIWTPINMWNET